MANINVQTRQGASGIDVNTTPVTNGATGRVFFQKSDATVGQDERFTYDDSLKRLTLRAGGPLSSDVVFAVRNWTDTFNDLEVRSNNTIVYNGLVSVTQTEVGGGCYGGATSSAFGTIFSAAAFGNGTIGFQANMIGTGGVGFRHIGAAQAGYVTNGGIEMYSSAQPSKYDIPTCQMYGHTTGSDIHPRIRTQLGHFIDLRRQDLPTTPTTGEIATFLANIGLANLI
jgi:hypothetical protein